MAEISLPLEYRAEIIRQIVRLTQSGESCSVIGVAGSGKGNLCRHLLRPDVRLHYFGADVAYTVVLYLNCKPISPRSPQTLFLDALDQLGSAIVELDGAFVPLQAEVNALWKEAQTNPELLAKRNLDKVLHQIVHAGAQHIIFLLDDCDDLCAHALSPFFADLRTLRDNHKYRLVYVTLTRRELKFLRIDVGIEEDLADLIDAAGHTLPLPPHSEADTRATLVRIASRQNSPGALTDAEIRQLHNYSGGHAALTRALYFANLYKVRLNAPDAFAQLAHDAGVEDECEKIWNGLEEEEREALRLLVRREAPAEELVSWLIQVGILCIQPMRSPDFCSPIFATYVSGQVGAPIPARMLSMDFSAPPPEINVNGQRITSLKMPEYKVLHYLWDKRSQVCTPNELIPALYEGERKDPTAKTLGDPFQRLIRYIKEIKAKIGPAGQSIETVNNGYRLVA